MLISTSVRLGWGVLCVAGGGAYYFAKQSINADRAARHEAEYKKQAKLRRLEEKAYSSPTESYKKPKATPKEPSTSIADDAKNAFSKAADTVSDTAQRVQGLDHAGSPSSEASEDVAAVGHAPETTDQKMREKSKYEAAEPYRSKKGDRFS